MSPVAPIEAPFHPRVIIDEASDEKYVALCPLMLMM